MKLFDEIAIERQHQVNKWGGPEHDDEHSDRDWASFLRPRTQDMTSGRADRHELIESAALIVAWIESLDRLSAPKEPDNAK